MLRAAVWICSVLAALVAATQRQALAQPTAQADPAVAVLQDPTARLDDREEAARRIAGRHTAESGLLVIRFLTDAGNLPGQSAMAKAVAYERLTNPELVDPLFALLNGQTRQLCDAAGQALANFKSNPVVLTRLTTIANARTNEPARLAAIAAIGKIPEWQSGETLMALLTRGDEPAGIRFAVVRALGDLTGLLDYGQDVQRWQQWWSSNQGKSPAAFHADLVENRSQRFDDSQMRLADLAESVGNLLSAQYQTVPADARADFLQKLLSNTSPEIRVAGARIVRTEKSEGRPVPDPAVTQLRQMIADSNATVRLEVANALARMNDQAAFEPLLDQLNQESNPDVRAALAGALGFLENTKAVPRLIDLLGDPTLVVAKSSADSLKELGPKLRDSDPAMTIRAADALTKLLARTSQPGLEPVRESTVAAMVPLRRPELLTTLQRLTVASETPRVRRDAIRALGEIRDPRASETVVLAFADPEAGVRLDAVRAMGQIGSTEFSSQIAKLVDPKAEPDQSVRDEAWRVLQSFLPNLSQQQLAGFASQFDRDHEKKLAVLIALADMLLKNKQLDDWSDQKQNIGSELVALKRYDEAAVNYGLALDHKLKQPAPNPSVIQRLVLDRMRALLSARKYPEALQFASDWMRKDPEKIQDMAVLIKEETETLKTRAVDERNPRLLEDAMELIGLSRKMVPPLPDRYLSLLNEIEQQVRQAQAQLKRGSSVPEPRPLSGTTGAGNAGLKVDD